MTTKTVDFDWAIVEVMGHRTFAGRVEEVQVCGAGMLRVDVPEVEGLPAFSKLLSPAAIYGISPTDEATAREAARRLRARPLHIYQLAEPGPDVSVAGYTEAGGPRRLPHVDDGDPVEFDDKDEDPEVPF